MKVELNSEAVDSIMHSILLEDYQNLCSDIKNLESAKELPEYKQQDLEHNREYKAAMEKMLEYYIGYNWQDRL